MVRVRGRGWGETLSAVLLYVIAIAVLVAVGLSAAFKLVGDDLNTRIDEARGRPAIEAPGQPWMAAIAAPLAGDVSRSDMTALAARADRLIYRGERIREATGAGALLGLLLAIVSGRSDTSDEASRRRRDVVSPAAKTASNGRA